MDRGKKRILEGLKIAIEAELTGHEFYKNAAKTTKDPKGKKTFSKMAQEEMGHFNYLRHQYQSVLEIGGYDLSKKLTKGSRKRAVGLIFSKEIKSRIKSSHFEVSALSIGMKLEQDAMKLYRSCARKTQSTDVKVFYNELADWEEGHYQAFKNQLEMLKEEYFQANNFVPM
jgi:rubrerythrin